MPVLRHQIFKGNCLIIARTELLLLLDDFHFCVRCHLGFLWFGFTAIWLIKNNSLHFLIQWEVKSKSTVTCRRARFFPCVLFYNSLQWPFRIPFFFFNVQHSFEHCCEGTQVGLMALNWFSGGTDHKTYSHNVWLFANSIGVKGSYRPYIVLMISDGPKIAFC